MLDNSLVQPLSEAAFGTYRVGDVEEAIDVYEAEAWRRVEALLAIASDERTYDNTVVALAEATDELAKVRTIANHLAQVLGGEWHEANEQATEREAKLRAQLRFHQGIYSALLELRDRPGHLGTLSAPRQKYLNETVLNYERDGIALDQASQEELKQIAARLSAAEVAFTRHLVEASDIAGLAVADRESLDGLSDELIDTCRREAQARGDEGYWLAYNPPNYANVMANCRVRATRQAYYRAQVDLAAAANLPVAQEMLALRRRMANLLGYRDYSDYALELRMAKNGQNATSFVSDLAELYRPTAQTEHAELVAFARQMEADEAFEVDASDVATGLDFYYAKQMRAARVGLDEEQLRDYFTLDRTRDVLFATLTALYGLELRRTEAGTWHQDVEVYEIYDGGDHLSTVWCDWYARKGKVSGAWADALYVAPRQERLLGRPCLGWVVCNFPPPDSSGHSRLTLRDVETLWHELGHFVHFTCNMTELRQQASLACRWDFIEAPSQIMENWVWQEEVLAQMARHYETGNVLPGEVMAKLLEARRFRVASKSMRQLAFASEDLALHRSYQGTDATALLQYYRQLHQTFLPVPIYPEDATLAAFKHVFGGSEYASAYYSYKWAEAIEADLFSAFKPGKLLSRAVGMKYRNEVLARGAEVEPDELIEAFLGRPSTPAAMLERDGISVAN